MKTKTLVSSNKYSGKHIALESFNSDKVVAYGKDPAEVILKAREKGFKNAVLVFVPSKNMTVVY